MKTRELTLADIGLIAGTRGMLGAGLGLLLGEKLNAEQRRAVGWTLVLVGVVTTVPLLLNVLNSSRPLKDANAYEPSVPSVV
jgi:EamA domain-containing membrane protein RarD